MLQARHTFVLLGALLGAQMLPLLANAATARVEAVQYPAWVERGTQGERREALQPGTQVRSPDTIVSGARMLLSLPDASTIRLGANSRLQVERLRSDKDSNGVSVDVGFKLTQGFFRYASNSLTKLTGKRKVDLTVATATIGIRGTDYWAMTDAEHDAACVFEGKVEVATRSEGVVSLDQPTAFWSRFFDKPAAVTGTASPAELSRFIASVEPQAGQGIAIIGGKWRVVAAAEAKQGDARKVATALNEAGYPAAVVKQNGAYEVRINHYASRGDAESSLGRLAAQAGMTGTDAKVVLTR
ncbi:MAG: SPOR domain-containing protein [Rhodocyclaceae bacterium]|nr:SPOR domain-containing protein [Rhodocyclaceae bacterium]